MVTMPICLNAGLSTTRSSELLKTVSSSGCPTKLRPGSRCPKEAAKHGLTLNQDGQRRTAFELLSYPTVSFPDLARIWPRFGELAPKIAEQIEIDAKYDVYLSRQAADVAAYRRDESFALPDDLDYAALPGLSNEVRQKLTTQKPRTIGHASKIDGVTPAALTLLVAHVKRGRGKPAKSA